MIREKKIKTFTGVLSGISMTHQIKGTSDCSRASPQFLKKNLNSNRTSPKSSIVGSLDERDMP